jgi:TIR domain-containing protein
VVEKIFLSYRRDDSAGQAGRVSDKLGAEFGEERLFLDVDGVRPGRDFHKQLTDAISNSAVLLAFIGPQWLDARDEDNNRRIDDPNDWVRIEIGAALKRDIVVIPVLLDGTKIPKANLLPEDLRGLSTRGAIEVRHTSFRADTDRLVRELREILSNSEPPIRSGGEPPRVAGEPLNVVFNVEPPILPSSGLPPIPSSSEFSRILSAAEPAESVPAWLAGSTLGFMVNINWLFPLVLKLDNSISVVGLRLLGLSLFAVPAMIPSKWLPTAPLVNAAVVGFSVGFLSMCSAFSVLAMAGPPTDSAFWPIASTHLFLTAVSLWLFLRKPWPWIR